MMLQLMFTALLPWYVMERPVIIVKTYIRYFKTFNEIIGFNFLILTLFSPWKSIVDEYPKSGYFDLNRVMLAITMNITSRTIGFIIRSSTIIFGLAFQLILFVVSLTYFLTWISFPFLFLVGVHFLVTSLV